MSARPKSIDAAVSPEVTRRALKIADESAWSFIEGVIIRDQDRSRLWLPPPGDIDNCPYLWRCMKYLRLRGLIEEGRERGDRWVRLK